MFAPGNAQRPANSLVKMANYKLSRGVPDTRVVLGSSAFLIQKLSQNQPVYTLALRAREKLDDFEHKHGDPMQFQLILRKKREAIPS